MDDVTRETLKRIGGRIREIRQQRGMNQQELSALIGVALSTVSEIERGNKGMRLMTFIKIAEALQVSADVLLRMDVPPVPSVNEIYREEFADLFQDCSSEETDSIIRIVKEIKTTMHRQKNTED